MQIDKLSIKQRKILSFIHLNASASYEEIAKACGTKSHVARSEVANFIKHKIITPCIVANYAQIGILKYHMYFSIRPLNEKDRVSFIEDIKNHPRVAWLCDFTGEYDFGLSFMAKSVLDLDIHIRPLLEQYKGIIQKKEILLESSWRYFGKKYLFNEHTFLTPIRVQLAHQTTTIDTVDKYVLQILSTDAFTPLQQIAKQMHIPLSTVHSRIKSMKEKKIIAGYIHWIRYSKIKLHAFRVLIDFGGLNDSQRKQLEMYCSKNIYIVSLIFTVGAWDMELGVDLEDPYHIHKIIAEISDVVKSSVFNAKLLQRHDDIKWNTISPGVFD